MSLKYSEFAVLTEENFSIIYVQYYTLLVKYAYLIV